MLQILEKHENCHLDDKIRIKKFSKLTKFIILAVNTLPWRSSAAWRPGSRDLLAGIR